MPTTAERPITTASRPSISIAERRRISTAACAVAGRKPSYPRCNRPALSGWIPSMSLAGSIASMTVRSRIVPGSGIWTITPSTVGSSLSSRTVAVTLASVASPSSSTKPLSIPTLAQPRRIRSR